MKIYEYGDWLRLYWPISEAIYFNRDRSEWHHGSLDTLPAKYSGWHFEFYKNGYKKASGVVPSDNGRSILWAALNK